jgi:hypothetical protein
MLILGLLACHGANDLAVVDVTDLGPLETTPAVKARDGGYSAAFQGRSVWLYGDSILSLAGEDGTSWRDNSWSFTADLDPSDGLSGFEEPTDALGAPVEFFPETADEAAYNDAHRDTGAGCADEPCGAREVLWPKAMVTSEDDASALIFYVKIHGEPGDWNFFDRGTGIATWSAFDAPIERPVVRDGDEPTLLWDAGGIAPGTAALVESGTIYAYSCEEAAVGRPCRLGRVAFADALDPAAWSYFDGRDWSADPDAAASLFDGAPQLSVAWNAALGRYLAVYDDLGTVRIRTASAPEGPWSRAIAAFDTEEPADGGWTYCGIAHPEYDDGASILVSYYRGTGDWTGEIRVVRVTLD